ncbi:MAG: S-adenosylmethionine:tRNA ribosyltransferase-isomerase, partial [Akkermansia sp.]
MRTIDFDYNLPEELIADRPLPDRSASRMLVIHRDTGAIEHRHFSDLPEYIVPGDHLVLNNTRVVAARFFSNDGGIEIVRADALSPLLWKCMVRPGKKMKIGRTIQIGLATGTVEEIDHEGYRLIRFDREVDEETYGRLALPHYMNRESDPEDKERYQTVYAKYEGAIAAPTAGLHFTPELLASIPHSFLTLHVGVGTFRPVKVDQIEDHEMHTERFVLPQETANEINQAKRVIAVGTT